MDKTDKALLSIASYKTFFTAHWAGFSTSEEPLPHVAVLVFLRGVVRPWVLSRDADAGVQAASCAPNPGLNIAEA